MSNNPVRTEVLVIECQILHSQNIAKLLALKKKQKKTGILFPKVHVLSSQ